MCSFDGISEIQNLMHIYWARPRVGGLSGSWVTSGGNYLATWEEGKRPPSPFFGVHKKQAVRTWQKMELAHSRATPTYSGQSATQTDQSQSENIIIRSQLHSEDYSCIYNPSCCIYFTYCTLTCVSSLRTYVYFSRNKSQRYSTTCIDPLPMPYYVPELPEYVYM